MISKIINEQYSQIRGKILLMDPLPPVNKIFSLVIQEERQREISTSSVQTTPVALNVQGNLIIRRRISTIIRTRILQLALIVRELGILLINAINYTVIHLVMAPITIQIQITTIIPIVLMLFLPTILMMKVLMKLNQSQISQINSVNNSLLY